MEIRENFSLKNLNTFHLDVRSRYFAEVANEEDIRTLIKDKKLASLPKLILGGGSNILFTRNFEGLVIKNNISGIEVTGEDDEHIFVTSGGGVVWHELVMYCIKRNFAGIENLSLIPGSVGAGPIQNIGAYGVELKDIFHELSAINLISGEREIFNAEACKFGYRNSIFKQELKNRMMISSVTFRLNRHPVLHTGYGAIEQELKRKEVKEKTILAISEAVCSIRRSKLPDPEVLGNCGSFFKNPEINLPEFEEIKKKFPEVVGFELPGGRIKLAAGWMIEQCGWKGKRTGNTGAHKDQALVLVNYGGATGMEILELSKKIQHSVFEKFGVRIEAEVNIL